MTWLIPAYILMAALSCSVLLATAKICNWYDPAGHPIVVIGTVFWPLVIPVASFALFVNFVSGKIVERYK